MWINPKKLSRKTDKFGRILISVSREFLMKFVLFKIKLGIISKLCGIFNLDFSLTDLNIRKHYLEIALNFRENKEKIAQNMILNKFTRKLGEILNNQIISTEYRIVA